MSMQPILRLDANLYDHEVPGGARRSRTDDILLAKQALYQLSYGPITLQCREQAG